MQIKRVIGLMVCECFISKIRRLLSEWIIIPSKCYHRHALVCYVLLISAFCFSSSVYTIGHGGGPWTYWCPLNAFDIVDDQIVFRNSVDVPKHGAGGIDLAMDELTNTLFVTFESDEYGAAGNYIEIVDAITLQNTTRTIGGVSNLTSIVFDAIKRKLYATDRNTNLLHVLGWNPAQKTVSLEKTIQLENIDYACGLAIDGDLLYVSEFYYRMTGNMDYYSDVNCYRISEDFAFVESIDMGDKTVAIDYDPIGNILYGGAYAYTEQYQHLIKNPLDDPNGLLQKEIGAGVIGIACDDTTAGRVFLTTYRNHGIQYKENYGSIEMWDTADWQAEPNTLPITEVTAIYDDLNTDGANMASLAGIIVTETPKPPIQIVKTDNVQTCISPESVDPNVVYTIGVSDPNGQTDLWIVDYLPREVDFVSASPQDPNYGYDLQTHTYTWFLPSLAGYDPNDPNSIPGGDPNEYFTLTARVNGWAEPMGSFVNLVTAESAVSYGWTAVETDVCCWGGNVIYVDPQAVEDTGYISFGGLEGTWATGRNTGTSWEDAYRDLPRALARAAKGCGSEIWVVGGTYRPVDTVLTDTFKIPTGVSVYGGFVGNETNRDQRDFRNNETTLSGFIALVPDGWGGYYETRNNIVVTLDGSGALLDGFTITDAADYGVYSSGKDFTIENCVVENNQHGIYTLNSNITVKWCEINDNGRRAVHHYGSGKFLTIENCKIHTNQWDGIYTDQSIPTILNSLIYQNGLGSTAYNAYYGVNLLSPYSNPTIRNNTIVQNVNEGIRRSGGNIPAIKNCIVYYNNDEGAQLAGLYPSHITWSCISDCNDINNQHNFNDEPGFAYTTEPNNQPVVGNYHLVWDSPCVDAGDSDQYTDELDIDGDSRIYGSKVEIGADEVTCTDTSNPNDWNADGVINLFEFKYFSQAWLTVSTDLNYNAACDLDTDLDVDLADLMIFIEDAPWLWIACWRTDLLEMQTQQSMQMMMAPDSEGMSVQSEIEAVTVESAIVIPAQAGIQSDSEIMPVVEEKSIEEQILDLQDSIEFLEKLWTEESDIQQEIDADEWQEFMNSVYQSLTDLKTLDIQTE